MKKYYQITAVLLALLIGCGSAMACGVKKSKGTHGTDSTQGTGK